MDIRQRHITRLIKAIDSQDGAGVKLKRSLGQNQLTRVDPFLMLDAFSSANPDDYIAGFPPHPHRGFETVTYMLDGHMVHRDHMGNVGDLRAGGVQWMTAGRGVIHEERPKMTNGLMRGFQLWINLPAKEKMKPAAYQNIEPEDIPLITLANANQIKLIAGTLSIENNIYKGPISSGSTEAIYIDISLQKGTEVTLPLPPEHSGFIYLFEGNAEIEGNSIATNGAAVLTQGNQITISAPIEASRMLLIAGKPIGEPIAQYGPFVMNTMEEIEQAIRDYQQNSLTD